MYNLQNGTKSQTSLKIKESYEKIFADLNKKKLDSNKLPKLDKNIKENFGSWREWD
jgi:hypothetical protein